MTTITICMGSSCFSQGSHEIVSVIEHYIEDQSSTDLKIELRGCLCLDKCTDGPIVIIGDKQYSGVRSDSVIELLKKHL